MAAFQSMLIFFRRERDVRGGVCIYGCFFPPHSELVSRGMKQSSSTNTSENQENNRFFFHSFFFSSADSFVYRV